MDIFPARSAENGRRIVAALRKVRFEVGPEREREMAVGKLKLTQGDARLEARLPWGWRVVALQATPTSVPVNAARCMAPNNSHAPKGLRYLLLSTTTVLFRSRNNTGAIVRYIEVISLSGRWDTRGVGVTYAEFEKAQQLGENYWLAPCPVRTTHDTENRAIDRFRPPQTAQSFCGSISCRGPTKTAIPLRSTQP